MPNVTRIASILLLHYNSNIYFGVIWRVSVVSKVLFFIFTSNREIIVSSVAGYTAGDIEQVTKNIHLALERSLNAPFPF